MGLFFEVLSAINNPHQSASIDQLSSLTGSVQQLATQNGISAGTMQSVLSSLGGALAPALQQQLGAGGGQQLGGLLGQLTGGNLAGNVLSQATSGNLDASSISSLIPPQVQQQIAQVVAQKTGLNAGMIQGLLPTLLPTVLGFFKMGASTTGGGNPLLNAFLDSNHDGNTDLGDMIKFADRFLNAQYQPS